MCFFFARLNVNKDTEEMQFMNFEEQKIFLF